MRLERGDIPGHRLRMGKARHPLEPGTWEEVGTRWKSKVCIRLDRG